MALLDNIRRIFLSDEDMTLRRKDAMENMETAILSEIGKAMSSSMVDKEKTHRLITEAVLLVLQVERSILLLKDERGETLRAEAGSGMIPAGFLETFRVRLGEGVMGSVAAKGEPRLVCDLRKEEGVIQRVVDELQVESILVAPLRIEGRILGVITADTKRSGAPFSESDLKRLTVLADLAAITEENASLIERLKDKANRLNALFDIGRAMNSTLKLQDLLDLIIGKAIDITKASSGSIMLTDREAGCLIIRSARGLSAEVMRQVRLKIGEGVTGWVAEKGLPLIIPDVHQDARYRSVNEKVRSELAVPLIREAEVIGVINVDHYDLDAFTCWDMETLATLASAAVVALTNAELFERLEVCSGGKA